MTAFYLCDKVRIDWKNNPEGLGTVSKTDRVLKCARGSNPHSSVLMTPRKSSEISRQELIAMIARLRGLLYSIKFYAEEEEDDFEAMKKEIEAAIKISTFDIDISDEFLNGEKVR